MKATNKQWEAEFKLKAFTRGFNLIQEDAMSLPGVKRWDTFLLSDLFSCLQEGDSVFQL